MITAVDTSVLMAIDRGETGAEAWLGVLEHSRREGALCICEAAAAEFFALVLDRAAFRSILGELGVEFRPLSLEAACRAGETFRAYRNHGGPRPHLLPDFLIAAHAEVDADRLATLDRGYLRRYFPKLRLLHP